MTSLEFCINVNAVISCLALCMVDIEKFVIPSRGFIGIQGCIHHICRSNYILGTIDVCRCMYFFLTCWWRTLTYLSLHQGQLRHPMAHPFFLTINETMVYSFLATREILPWSKSSRNSFRKFKIQLLFIKSDIVPFKVLPIDCNALMPALDPALETIVYYFWNYCRYSHQSRLRFFHYLLSAVKMRSPYDFLTRSNRKKSQGAIQVNSRLLDGIRFVLGQKFIMMALCDGTLSWSKSMSC